jgi:ABC-type phosphate transport system substrate-binding protein
MDGKKLEAAKAEFRQLEANSSIQRSTSPWASPLHMVQKKDGSCQQPAVLFFLKWI